MKKVIYFVVCVFVLLSCKKEKQDHEIQVTDVTGWTILKGHLSKDIILPDGNGAWIDSGSISADNRTIHVTINRSAVYPGSSVQGAAVYEAKSNANGDYSVSVKTNATGVAAKVTIDGFIASLDTLINGITKTGLSNSFGGTAATLQLQMGSPFTFDYHFVAIPLQTDPNAIKTGTAIISGSVGIQYFKETIIGSLPPFYNPVIVPYPGGLKVYLSVDKDPGTLYPRYYETLTDGDGYYKFLINTVDPGTPGFPQTAQVWVADLADSQDTIKMNNTVRKGVRGVFKSTGITLNGVFSTSINNATHLSYTTFVPD